jgi:hypothetical protein
VESESSQSSLVIDWSCLLLLWAPLFLEAHRSALYISTVETIYSESVCVVAYSNTIRDIVLRNMSRK